MIWIIVGVTALILMSFVAVSSWRYSRGLSILSFTVGLWVFIPFMLIAYMSFEGLVK